ncbi:hypothetical protein H6G76_11710 [Nostoc sp. FACHB-152]|uniref:hypothetical protein n=1 Tax=unclassified Nostoc TaxID=2593658 RepID=UPI001683F984|nr:MULTISPECIES: hypothetical protein [unclassified Nostoc]MBD2447831.1 hypothetical protein [Nostoc sp. FACHB-152]MBD2468595.1 hypothetical protein [Nostoc sp. FACHB-145]
MNHLNVKSLSFYGIAIASVLLLFNAVTAYGENKLKAPPVVNGSYQVKLAENLPNCKDLNPLVLNIQQSGIYLNASLVPENANAETKKQLSLTGILKDQQLNLSGKVAPEILCNPPNSQANSSQSAIMQMQLAEQGKITGQLTLNNSKLLKFIAVQQPISEQSQKLTNH